MAPTSQCFVADNDYLASAADAVTDEPGRYPVDWNTFDGTDLVLLTEQRPR